MKSGGVYEEYFEHGFLQQKPLLAVVVAELVGTFVLCFLIQSTLLLTKDELTVALAIATLIWALCTILGDFSGAQFNPAVTLAWFLSDRRFTTLRAAVIICTEIVGAIAGVQLGIWLQKGELKNPYTYDAHKAYTVAQCFVIEIIYTAILAGTVVRGAVTRTTSNGLNPLWVSGAVSFTSNHHST